MTNKDNTAPVVLHMRSDIGQDMDSMTTEAVIVMEEAERKVRVYGAISAFVGPWELRCKLFIKEAPESDDLSFWVRLESFMCAGRKYQVDHFSIVNRELSITGVTSHVETGLIDLPTARVGRAS